jgi:hypothetical protein
MDDEGCGPAMERIGYDIAGVSLYKCRKPDDEFVVV